MSKIIDEVKELTESAVSKKQDAAKLNFPTIIEKIKTRAAVGESICLISTDDMNEYDRALLQAEGFRCSLIDKPKSRQDAYNALAQYVPKNDKVWEVKW